MLHTLHNCHDELCSICRGGLSVCDVCGGAEGSLPTDCPGRKLTQEECDRVFAGTADFRKGEWVRPNSSPKPRPSR